MNLSLFACDTSRHTGLSKTLKRKTKNTIFGCFNLPLNRRDKVTINRLCNGLTRLTHGYLMEKEEKLKWNPCGTKFSVNNIIITEWLQYVDEFSSLNIPNTLDTALRPDVDTTTQILKFLKKSEFYYLI